MSSDMKNLKNCDSPILSWETTEEHPPLKSKSKLRDKESSRRKGHKKSKMVEKNDPQDKA